MFLILKKDVMQTLSELGLKRGDIFIDDKTPQYYHPGKSGVIFAKKRSKKYLGIFWRITSKYFERVRYKNKRHTGF